MPTLKIDGKEITVDKGTTIIQAAQKLGIFIPNYCYHPGLSIAGNCRMCLVQVEKMPKPQIACHIQCQDGMVVDTQSENVKKLREHILEFLLVNHPLDCPVCDQAGECWLQDYYMKFGLYESRLNENKVKKHAKAKQIGPAVMLDSERCILCSRCVRYADEITKTGDFGIFNRGDHSEIGLYPGREWDNKYSGNVVDICPVGALTDRDFRFKLRVWYLKKTESVCTSCARGCNITIETNATERTHHAGGERVMRLKPRFNDHINDWWMCDEGRYRYKFIDHGRILNPSKRVDRQLKEIDWDSAIGSVASVIKNRKSKSDIAVLLSPDMSNEELYLAKQLFSKELGLESIYLVRARQDGYGDEFLIRADKHSNRKGAELLGLIENPKKIESLFTDAASGKIKQMIVFGQDLISLFPSNVGTFKNVEIIFIGSNHNLTSEAAKWVLPAATYAEKDGTFTNFEGWIQRARRALEPLGESRSESEILEFLANALGFRWSYESAKEVFDEFTASVPQLDGINYEKIGKSGMKV